MTESGNANICLTIEAIKKKKNKTAIVRYFGTLETN